jgi:hypothetical protein
MRRQRSIIWKPARVEGYVDYRSSDGHWWIAEGFDTYEAKRGKPFLLMHCANPTKDYPWKRIDGFRSLREAKHFAEEISE